MRGLTLANAGFVGSLASPPPSGPVTNRAVVFQNNNMGSLAIPGALNLGTAWRFTARLRTVSTNAQYVMDFNNEGMSFIYGFIGPYYELFMPSNLNGIGGRRLASAAINDGLYHTIDFVYAGGVLTCYTDGVAGNTLSEPGLSPAPNAGQPFKINPFTTWSGAVDYARLEASGSALIDFPFNEADAVAPVNTGSLGGTMSFSLTDPPRETL